MAGWLEDFYAFLDRPLRPWSRLVLVGLIVFLMLSYWFPLWRISMEAPQYPRGLYLDIFVYYIQGGDGGQHLQEINTLNHYIGMRPLDPADLSDLGWMPFALGILALLTLRVAAVGNVRSLIDLSVIVVYVLGFMAARFVYRLYRYGHDLDPEAPFTVEPFTPVIIGTKQVANFTTHSWPQVGTLFITIFAAGVSILALYHLVAGYVAHRRERKRRVSERAPARATAKVESVQPRSDLGEPVPQ